MPVALKAQWVVRGGFIPGEPMESYTEVWSYTSVHYEADGNRRGEEFERMDAEASRHAARLRAGGVNCVTLEYLWM